MQSWSIKPRVQGTAAFVNIAMLICGIFPALFSEDDKTIQGYVSVGKAEILEEIATVSWSSYKELVEKKDLEGAESMFRIVSGCLSQLWMTSPPIMIPPIDELGIRRISSEMRTMATEIESSDALVDKISKTNGFDRKGVIGILQSTAKKGSVLIADNDKKQQELDDALDLINGKTPSKEFADRLVAAGKSLKLDLYDGIDEGKLISDIHDSMLVTTGDPLVNLSQVPAIFLNQMKTRGISDLAVLKQCRIIQNPATHSSYFSCPDSNGKSTLHRIP